MAREPYLAMARKCAELTIPRLVPPPGRHKRSDLTTPYQSVGSRCVNNLANKLLMALFPTNTPFFRMSIGQFDLQRLVAAALLPALEEGGAPADQAARVLQEKTAEVNRDLEMKLAAVETAVMREFEVQRNRPTDVEALKQLIVTGNVLRLTPPDASREPRIYTLNSYVVKRDPDGVVLEMITREGVTALSLSPAIRDACGVVTEEDAAEKEYALFTHIRRTYDDRGEYWAVVQELNGFAVPGSEGEYEIDDCPWLALRWTKVDGEDYGRGHVEEYLGDLASLEGLSEAMLHSALGSAKTLVFVNPNSQYGTSPKKVAQAKNGAVLTGHAGDVTFLQANKYHDLRTPIEQLGALTQGLYYAFLVTAAVQRDAERVTAQEIRIMAQELETALGGVYTTLGHEYQRPLVQSIIKAMTRSGSLPELPKDVKPIIITGMDALGRNTEYQRLAQLLQSLALIQNPQEIAIRLDVRGIMNRLAASSGVNPEGIFLAEEIVEAIKQQQAEHMQQQQMAALVEKLGPQAIKAQADAAAAGQARGAPA